VFKITINAYMKRVKNKRVSKSQTRLWNFLEHNFYWTHG